VEAKFVFRSSTADIVTVDAELCDWYALQVKNRLTLNVAETLRRKGYDAFTPCYSIERQWSDRVKAFKEPVLLGYVFVRIDPRYRMPILTTPGVYNFVGVGKQPSMIQQEEIDTVRGLVRSGLMIEPWPYLRRGDRARIEKGPLRGLTGILVDVRNACRVVISVEAIQRSIAVHINRDCVSRIALESADAFPQRGIARAATSMA
jgi:transcription antitermination factor NusG